jgi:alpha,alpha-trehalase
MRGRAKKAFAGTALWCVALFAVAAAPQPPSIVYGELFDAVQRGAVFTDSKTFADAIPKQSPADILAAYKRERGSANFDLERFVAQHFDEPDSPATNYHSDPSQDVCAHIDALWPVLTRGPDAQESNSSLLPLPHRYVVPGGRYREVYYWDSYFTMLGLEAAGHHDLVIEMLDNFAYLIDTFGHIPNGNRSYYLSRSQPPFFAAMITSASEGRGDALYEKYLPQLEREHEFWMEGAAKLRPGVVYRRVVRLANGALLNRYFDDRAAPRDESYREDIATAKQSRRPAAEVYRDLRAAAESGWDFSSRWLKDGKTLSTIHTTDYVPPDLNALLVELERAIARGYAAKQDGTNSEKWARIAETRARAIRDNLWNARRGAFSDYLWRERKLADTVTAAALYPLYFGIATRDQAQATAKTVRLTLLRPEGIVPTTIVSGQQWDAPNGWPPLEWIAIRGLARFGENDLSNAIALGWQRENVEGFRKSGKLVEKYDVTGDADAKGGEYPTQDGFGWTNGVLRASYCKQKAQ